MLENRRFIEYHYRIHTSDHQSVVALSQKVQLSPYSDPFPLASRAVLTCPSFNSFVSVGVLDVLSLASWLAQVIELQSARSEYSAGPSISGK